MLMEDVTDEEVKYALSSAKTSSAPGPSGQSIATFKYLYVLSGAQTDVSQNKSAHIRSWTH